MTSWYDEEGSWLFATTPTWAQRVLKSKIDIDLFRNQLSTSHLSGIVTRKEG